MINTLEKLFIAVIGAVSMLFIYGMLSMAWAGEPTFADAPYLLDEMECTSGECVGETTTWILMLLIGPQPTGVAHHHTFGHFPTKEQCEFVGKSVTRDLRAHGSRGTEFYCGSQTLEPKHGQ